MFFSQEALLISTAIASGRTSGKEQIIDFKVKDPFLATTANVYGENNILHVAFTMRRNGISFEILDQRPESRRSVLCFAQKQSEYRR